MREQYTYKILRYRHDPLSGEQVNVGLLLWAPKSRYLGVFINKQYGRLVKIFPSLDGKLLKADLSRIEKLYAKLHKELRNQFQFENQNADHFADRLLSFDDTSLVWSEMGSGISLDPEKELERLAHRFIIQNELIGPHVKTDNDIWKPFLERLNEKYSAASFEVKTIRTDISEVKFDHSLKNGKWHCIQPLSFDLSTDEGIQDKAAKWAGNMIGISKSIEDIQTYFLVGKPKNMDHLMAFERAMRLLAEAPRNPRVVREDQIENFVDEFVNVINH